jgi:mannose-6-phosphate isomerase-like protein (cupin superfamily)
MVVTEAFVIGAPAVRTGPWRVIAGADRTGGAVTFGDADLPPHSPGPGRHVHAHEDEAVYVVSGVLSFCVGDHRFDAGPQTLVWLPRQVPHVFANLSDEPVRGVGVITPAGLEGMFAEHAAYFAGLAGPPDAATLHAIGARYGVLPVDGPPLTPIPTA